MFENIIMKLAEIALRKGKENKRVNLIKIYCKHIGKCHNMPSVQLLYDNKK
jgi:hypothetical protein